MFRWLRRRFSDRYYVTGERTLEQVGEDLIDSINEIQNEYGVDFEFVGKGDEFYFRLLKK